MAKNVIITEDGHSKTILNATRIRTALEGGGTCDWIPKEDVPLQELTVTEDGVYDPEDGYYGFSQVTANGVGTVVEGTLIEKTVTKNGTYNITDESGNPYGYSKITVNVDTSDDDSGGGSGGGGSNPVVGKDEDGNDTMAEADDDGNIVMTALPTEIKVIIPPTKLEYNRYEEIDYSGISVYAYISKAVHWLGTTTTAVSEGSSHNNILIGGKNVTVSVGDGVLYAPDRTGANDIQLVWDGGKWVKPANYRAEKAIWKSDKYPTGKVPFGELMFPIKRTDNIETGDEGSALVAFLDDRSSMTIFSGDAHYSTTYELTSGGTAIATIETEKTRYHTYIIVDSLVYVVVSNAKYYLTTQFEFNYPDGSSNKARHSSNYARVAVVPVGENINFRINYSNRVVGKMTSSPFSYGTNGSLINKLKYGYDRIDYGLLDCLDQALDNIDKLQNALSITLPVQWKRPGDGKILETTFTAWMKDEGDNNTSGGNTRPGGPNIDVPQ